MNGNTRYYIRLESSDVYYSVNISEYEEVVTFGDGDNVKIEYSGNGAIRAVVSIEKE